MKTTEELTTMKELSQEELIKIFGGSNNIWELLGYVFTYHAREVMYSDCSPSVLAYK